MVFFCLLGIFGGTTLYIAWNVSTPWSLVMVGVYGLGATVLVRSMWDATALGRKGFERSVAAVQERLERRLDESSLSAESRERSLASYLLLPRPEDLIKSPFLPVAFIIAACATSSDWRRALVAALVIWAVLELLVYQARYQWNDLRGVGEDALDPKRLERRRLPTGRGLEAAMRASARAAGARLYIALVAAWIPIEARGIRVGFIIAWLIVAVFALAIAYEWFRERDSSSRSRPFVSWFLYLLVGIGYALRGLTGLWLGDADARLPGVAYLAFGLYLAAFGSTLVVMTWTHHGYSFCLQDPTSGPTDYLEVLDRRPHLRYLLESNGTALARSRAPNRRVNPVGARFRALERRGRLFVPWNVLTVVTGTLSGIAGIAIVLPVSAWWIWLTAALLSFGGSAALALADSSRQRTFLALTDVALMVGVVSFLEAPVGWQRYIGIVPFAALAAIVVSFRGTDYASMKDLGGKVLKSIRRFFGAVFVVIVGARAARLVMDERRGGAATP